MVDRNVIEYAQPQGTPASLASISRAPLPEPTGGELLRFRERTVMIRPSWAGAAVRLLIGVVGLAMIACGVWIFLAPPEPDWRLQFGALAIGGAVGLILGILGFISFVNAMLRRIRIDLDAGSITVHSDEVGYFGAGRVIRFQDVAALQLCGDPWESETPAYQVNLVLSQPFGERVTLIYCIAPAGLLDDAEKLASLLKVPLLEHLSAVGRERLRSC